MPQTQLIFICKKGVFEQMITTFYVKYSNVV